MGQRPTHCTCSEQQLARVGCNCGFEHILTIRDCGAAQGPAYEVNTEDGPAIVANWFVWCSTTQGEWAHTHRFGPYERYQTEQLAARVQAAGNVDSRLWRLVEPYNREEAEAYNLREECDAGEWSFGVPGTAEYR